MPNTREKLIELISQVQYLGGLEEKVADHLIANGVTVQKWIHVSERLPEHFGQFLVTVKEYNRGWYADSAMYDPYKNEWRTNLFCGMRDEVTHWMPLPEPPKGE